MMILHYVFLPNKVLLIHKQNVWYLYSVPLLLAINSCSSKSPLGYQYPFSKEIILPGIRQIIKNKSYISRIKSSNTKADNHKRDLAIHSKAIIIAETNKKHDHNIQIVHEFADSLPSHSCHLWRVTTACRNICTTVNNRRQTPRDPLATCSPWLLIG